MRRQVPVGQSSPRLVPAVLRGAALLVVVVLGTFLGRPVYWQLEDQARSLREHWLVRGRAQGRDVSDLLASDGRRSTLFRDPDVDGPSTVGRVTLVIPKEVREDKIVEENVGPRIEATMAHKEEATNENNDSIDTSSISEGDLSASTDVAISGVEGLGEGGGNAAVGGVLTGEEIVSSAKIGGESKEGAASTVEGGEDVSPVEEDRETQHEAVALNEEARIGSPIEVVSSSAEEEEGGDPKAEEVGPLKAEEEDLLREGEIVSPNEGEEGGSPRDEELSNEEEIVSPTEKRKKEGDEEAMKAEAAAEEGETAPEPLARAGEAANGERGAMELANGVRPILHEDRPLAEVLQHEIWEAPPPGTPVPPRTEFALRKSMVDFRATSNVIVVTFSNFAFLEFVTNWVRHLTDVGVTNVLVGAMDVKILEALFLLGVPVFDLESNMPTVDAGWGSALFHKMGREKVTLVNVFLALGYELLICDTDMVWLKDPLPYFARWPDAELFTSSDDLAGFAERDGLEPWEKAQGAYNIGILFFRPTPGAMAMGRRWAELLASNEGLWDQNGFNDILRAKPGPAVLEGGNVFWGMGGEVKMAVLPVAIFCSGHTFFVQQKYKKLKLPLYAIHTTFQFAGTEGKRHRLREATFFYDPPEYYDPPGGVITFRQNIPSDILHGGDHNVTTHFALVNYQLRQIRNLFALAVILNRIVVMPPMWCRLDRMWFEHPGILDGTMTDQPFLCPMDHVFEVWLAVLLGSYPQGGHYASQVYAVLGVRILEVSLLVALKPFIRTGDVIVETVSKLCDLATAGLMIWLLDQSLSGEESTRIGFALLALQFAALGIQSLYFWYMLVKESIGPSIRRYANGRRTAVKNVKAEYL